MYFFDIAKKTLAAWYEFRIRENSLIVDVHPKAWKFFLEALRRNPRILDGYGDLEIPEFIPVQEKPWVWGFGGALTWRKSERGKWISVICHPPVFPTAGKPFAPVWNKLFSISATLGVLFEVLMIFEEEIMDYYSSQLMAISGWLAQEGCCGGALSVLLSKDLCEFINKEVEAIGETTKYEPVVNAMSKMFLQIEKGELYLINFQAMLRFPKWLNLSVPGNACGLDPGDYNDGKTMKGYKLLLHNVDGPVQQFYLLTGLAALYDHARKWIWLDKKEDEIRDALSKGLQIVYYLGSDFTTLAYRGSGNMICGVDGEVTLKEIKERYSQGR